MVFRARSLWPASPRPTHSQTMLGLLGGAVVTDTISINLFSECRNEASEAMRVPVLPRARGRAAAILKCCKQASEAE
jgi:hypothetical protein